MKKNLILRSTTFWRSFFWVNLSFFSAIFKTVTQYPLLHILWSVTSKLGLLEKRETVCLISQRTIDCTSHGYRPTPFYTFIPLKCQVQLCVRHDNLSLPIMLEDQIPRIVYAWCFFDQHSFKLAVFNDV